MDARRTQWLNSKPQFTGGVELRPASGDVIFFNFVATGNDADQFLKLYKAHAIDQIAQKSGKPFQIFRYCPIQSQEGDECALCSTGHTSIKERFSVWLWVQTILHTELPAEKQFPRIEYQNRYYYKEDITTESNGVVTPGAFKVWHTSAWKESPWTDIMQLAQMYSGLHNFSAQMAVVGAGMQTRFKIYALPNSPALDPVIYERAKTECQHLAIMLKEQLATPVVAAPVPAQTSGSLNGGGTAGIVNAWVPPGSNIPSFNPVAPANPVAAATPPPVIETIPAPLPAQVALVAAEPAAPIASPPPATEPANPAANPTEEPKRPLKNLF